MVCRERKGLRVGVYLVWYGVEIVLLGYIRFGVFRLLLVLGGIFFSEFVWEYKCYWIR